MKIKITLPELIQKRNNSLNTSSFRGAVKNYCSINSKKEKSFTSGFNSNKVLGYNINFFDPSKAKTFFSTKLKSKTSQNSSRRFQSSQQMKFCPTQPKFDIKVNEKHYKFELHKIEKESRNNKKKNTSYIKKHSTTENKEKKRPQIPRKKINDIKIHPIQTPKPRRITEVRNNSGKRLSGVKAKKNNQLIQKESSLPRLNTQKDASSSLSRGNENIISASLISQQDRRKVFAFNNTPKNSMSNADEKVESDSLKGKKTPLNKKSTSHQDKLKLIKTERQKKVKSLSIETGPPNITNITFQRCEQAKKANNFNANEGKRQVVTTESHNQFYNNYMQKELSSQTVQRVVTSKPSDTLFKNKYKILIQEFFSSNDAYSSS